MAVCSNMSEPNPQPLLEQLAELDAKLLALLQGKLEAFDDVALNAGLEQRAMLLKQVVEQGEPSEQQVQEIIKRSKELTRLAEDVKAQLAEQLKTIQTGRRSQQAYQSVKYQE